MSPGATILNEVPPGDQSGLYYITICNLPFGTSWQKLKDWLRPATTADHIEIFPGSTSGWVRLKGRESFEKAWSVLNGGIYEGRSIIACDKNRSEPIKIKELVNSSSPTTHRQTVHHQTPRYQPATPSHYNSPSSPGISPQYGAASFNQYQTGVYPPATDARYGSSTASNYYHQPLISSNMGMPSIYATADPRDYYDTLNPASTSYSPTYGYDGSEYPLPYRGQADAHGSSPTEIYQPIEHAAGPSVDYSTHLPIEKRKIYISRFPHHANADDVKSWIYRKSGPYGDQIIGIEVPQSSNGDLRGHALAIFRTTASANSAIGLLQRQRYHDNKMVVRPAVEGVTNSEPSVPTGPRAMGSSHREKSHHSRHKDSKSSSSKHSSSERKHSSDKKSSGSSKKSSSSSSDKKKSSDKKSSSSSDRKSTRDGGPVIADGTSRKNDRH